MRTQIEVLVERQEDIDDMQVYKIIKMAGRGYLLGSGGERWRAGDDFDEHTLDYLCDNDVYNITIVAKGVKS